jgi:hypothetical protein
LPSRVASPSSRSYPNRTVASLRARVVLEAGDGGACFAQAWQHSARDALRLERRGHAKFTRGDARFARPVRKVLK